MPAIENVIRSIVVSDPTVAGLIGTRLYPVRLAQGATLPAMSYFVVDRTQPLTHEAYANLHLTRLQFTLHTLQYTHMQALSDALKTALRGLKGTYQGLNIQMIYYLNELDNDPSPDALGTQQFQRYIDFRVVHSEGAVLLPLLTEAGTELQTEAGVTINA